MVFSPKENTTPQDSRGVRLAEYTALRGEITTFLTLQVQFMTYSIVLGGALAGLYINQKSFEVVAFFPLPFLILGLLYLDAKARVLRVAKYIYTELRPALIDPADGLLTLSWEEFIRKEYDLRHVLSAGEKLRWAIFLVPSVVPIMWLIWNGPQPQHGPLAGSLFTVEFILFCLFIWIALKLDNYDKRLCEKEK
jgi:hypothetical protein